MMLLLSSWAFSVSKLGDLDSFVRSQMAEGHIPGLVAVAVNGSDILWSGAFGELCCSYCTRHTDLIVCHRRFGPEEEYYDTA